MLPARPPRPWIGAARGDWGEGGSGTLIVIRTPPGGMTVIQATLGGGEQIQNTEDYVASRFVKQPFMHNLSANL